MTVSNRLAECQRVIGYHFANPSLLEVALTHSSVRTPDRECNERLEFLGDSVLGLTITEELYKRLPDQQEGELTRIKSAVVSRGALYRVSTRLGLTRFIEVAKGVSRKEELPVSLTANLVESIIGAIYLDAGFFPAREFILKNLGPEVEDVMNDRVAKNYKSLLQHEAQQLLGATPVYRTLEEEGPDHRKAFVVAAVVRGTEYGRASGINKKEAEQEAARHALEALLRRRGGRRRRGGLTLDRLESRDLRDGRDYVVRDAGDELAGSDAGPGGDAAARGERYGRPVRGGRSLRGGGRRRRDDSRLTGSMRPSVAQSKDDADWQAWAEGAHGAPPPTPTAASSGPYVVGPEPEEAYFDAPAGSSQVPGAPSDAGPIPVPLSTPVPVEQPDDPGPPRGAPDEMPAGSSDADADDARRGRHRRGRRGGRRGRSSSADGSRTDAPEAAHEEPTRFSRSSTSPSTPAPSHGGSGVAPEADAYPASSDETPTHKPEAAPPEGLPAAFIAAEPGAGGAETPSWPDFGAEPPAPAPARRPREPRARAPRERAPRERAPRERTARADRPAPRRDAEVDATPPAPPTSKSTPTLPGFGAGVLGDASKAAPPPPPPAAARPPLSPAKEVPAVRKVPRAPAPPKPSDGGFGAGLA